MGVGYKVRYEAPQPNTMAGFMLNQQPLILAHALPDARSDGSFPPLNGSRLTSMTFWRPDGPHAFLCGLSAETALDAILDSRVYTATLALRQALADALEDNQWMRDALGEQDTDAHEAQHLIGQLGGAVAALEGSLEGACKASACKAAACDRDAEEQIGRLGAGLAELEATLLACEPSVCMARALKECETRALENEASQEWQRQQQQLQEVADQLVDLLDTDLYVLVQALDIAAAKSLDQQQRLARATALCAVRELQMQKLKASRNALEQNLKAAKAAKAEAEASLERKGRECEVSTALYGSPLGSSTAS